jgi:hypothetical protein
MNIYKIHRINNITWLICILLRVFLNKGSFIYQFADTMSTVNLFVFCIIIGWVVNDYLKNKFPEDETSEN